MLLVELLRELELISQKQVGINLFLFSIFHSVSGIFVSLCKLHVVMQEQTQ